MHDYHSLSIGKHASHTDMISRCLSCLVRCLAHGVYPESGRICFLGRYRSEGLAIPLTGSVADHAEFDASVYFSSWQKLRDMYSSSSPMDHPGHAPYRVCTCGYCSWKSASCADVGCQTKASTRTSIVATVYVRDSFWRQVNHPEHEKFVVRILSSSLSHPPYPRLDLLVFRVLRLGNSMPVCTSIIQW